MFLLLEDEALQLHRLAWVRSRVTKITFLRLDLRKDQFFRQVEVEQGPVDCHLSFACSSALVRQDPALIEVLHEVASKAIIDPLLVLRAEHTEDLTLQALASHACLFGLGDLGLHCIEKLFDFVDCLLVCSLSTSPLLLNCGGWCPICSAHRTEVFTVVHTDTLRFHQHLLSDSSFGIEEVIGAFV